MVWSCEDDPWYCCFHVGVGPGCWVFIHTLVSPPRSDTDVLHLHLLASPAAPSWENLFFPVIIQLQDGSRGYHARCRLPVRSTWKAQPGQRRDSVSWPRTCRHVHSGGPRADLRPSNEQTTTDVHSMESMYGEYKYIERL